ncbi:MAG: ftsY [Anaerolineales bacterium]|jgi:fused signal recognition particle receptor|nr:ftsY [Anaerolineales bacterium]MBM2847207.1 ftsY [Anaerolineales bacterium]
MLAAAKSLRDSLARTRQSVFGRIVTLLGQSDVSEATFDELEMNLIQADLGAALADEIVAGLERRAETEGIVRAEGLKAVLRAELRAQLGEPRPLQLNASPAVILLVGVNGSGKTTTAAKLARHFQLQERSVMLAAADTFRAAAVDQLQIWGERLHLPVIAGQPNADPGAVAHDALAAAKSRKTDVLIVDTAGRLQTKYNLMEELKKVRGVIAKFEPGAPHETLLVLDAVTGQNALSQAKAFKEAVGVTGVILAKLDGSAKGGMAFAIRRELGLPICFAGTGEQFEDFEVFDPDKFVAGLLD